MTDKKFFKVKELTISEDGSKVQAIEAQPKENNFFYEMLPIEYGGAFDSKGVV